MFRNGILLIVLGTALFALRTIMARGGIPAESATMFQAMLFGAVALGILGAALALFAYSKRES
ncbi:hypothetical protein [Jannaschia pohangensis]|uniref:Uncharacterized protein n=1 Tax=Jannaschia pohangensis TaxID=390807 RepID=A0A1I3QNK8_9RHOB|nr:hypothetical protein [Jannaschia pohangensis]SFJ35089.1 hypothetical protein SAMN04488095_2598 [Jannaschia pohangensis]